MPQLPVPKPFGHRLPPDRYPDRRPNLVRCMSAGGRHDASIDIDRKPE